jgi:hypothetical protein
MKRMLRLPSLSAAAQALFPVHISAAELQSQLPPRVFRRFFKFAFVRNPWDWQVSLYHYILCKPEHHQHALLRAMSGFDEYLEWRVSEDKMLQRDFLVDAEGRLLVDFVGRFERLSEDFQHVCRTLGVQATLPWLNGTPHDDYRSYYDSRTRKLVEEHFGADIDSFGYTFAPTSLERGQITAA